MEVENSLHMKTGNGESSYASNSFLQETVIRKTLPVLEQTIKGMANLDVVFSKCFTIADLGCSTGTNTLLVASNVIDIVLAMSKKDNHGASQFQIWLNDLFGNDFNSIFQSLPNFYTKLKMEKGENFGSCFVSATPGSFYGRLFPDESLHLVYTSYALHWLSEVPKGIENNKENIYISETSPTNVFKVYEQQFHTDFLKFLELRSKEVVRGGCMVLSFLGRSSTDPTSDGTYRLWELLAQSLLDMVKEGMVQESYMNSFNMPNYAPCESEVTNVIHNEGSFSLNTLNAFEVNWDPYDTDYTNIKDSDEQSHVHAKNTTKVVRAVTEPLVTSHFGDSMHIDMLYKNYEKKVAEHLAKRKTRHFNLVISLTRK